jgi:hypothetical protein
MSAKIWRCRRHVGDTATCRAKRVSFPSLSTGRVTHSNSRSVVKGGRNSRRLARGASYFRSSQWNSRIIEIIDESGVHSQQVLPGKMNIMFIGTWSKDKSFLKLSSQLSRNGYC